MKTLAKAALCAAYKYSGAMRLQEHAARRAHPPFMVVLLFHRVTDEIPEDGLTVGTERFRRLCNMLQRRFNVVPLREVFRLLHSNEPIPPRTVAITFDDCYRDNLFAARTLADHGLPACFFIPSAYVGTDHCFPWDRHLPPLANLTWDEVREMARLGFEIGSHTATHADLGVITDEQMRTELVQSKATLEARLEQPVRWLAYPFGRRTNFRVERLPLVHEAGYDGCLSAFGGFVRREQQPAILPRESVPEFKSWLNLELHMTGCLDWFYKLKRRVPKSGERGASVP